MRPRTLTTLLGSIVALALLSFSGDASSAESKVHSAIRAAYKVPKDQRIYFRSSREFKPPAMEKTKLYEVRRGTFRTQAKAGKGQPVLMSGPLRFMIMRTGAVKVDKQLK